jgi:hypothetical protein
LEKIDLLRGVSEVGKKGLFDPSMISLATSLMSFPSAGHEIPRKYNKIDLLREVSEVEKKGPFDPLMIPSQQV